MALDLQKSSFAIEVEQALKHYQNSEWLGEQSPLASPYFLGNKLPTTAIEAKTRGQFLQMLLAEATAQLHGRYAERYQIILREYYFNNRTVKEVCQEISLGHNSFHLSRNDAIEALATLLIKQMSPALRLETPPQHGQLWERDAVIEQCLTALQQIKSVSLIGSGGVGKSTLGSYVAIRSARPCFWYTIRRGLNDQLDALLFALGYFLHNCGSSTLWLELVAEGSQLKPERLVAVVRYALEQLTPMPLLCIDEADQLAPAEEASHVPIVRLLESLRGLVPMLIIGQQPRLDTDYFFTLTGLSRSATEQLLAAAGHRHPDEVVTALHTYAQGNPRLIELALMLLARGETAATLLETLALQPSVEFLLSRILQRLTETECALLMELAVFRRAAPLDMWQQPEIQEALAKLLTLRLVYQDRSGGVTLLPIYHTLLARQIPESKRRALHELVAERRALYGDYTAAAHHLVAAGHYSAAVQIWYVHRQSQINQGQAQNALATFRGIPQETLPKPIQEALTLIRAELLHLTGNDTKAISDINSILWQTPLLAIDAHHLAGRLANDQSNFTRAEEAFAEALAVSEAVIAARVSNVHCVLGWRHLRERKITHATTEAQRARYEVEQFEGEIQREIANYTKAKAHFLAALQLAETLDDAAALAKTATSLAVLYLFQAQAEQAKVYLQKAAENYERLGKVVQLASLQINWAVAHNLAGDYHQAIEAAQLARLRLARFGPIPPRQEALIFQAMAEAHLGLDNLNEAAMYVQQVVDLEEVDILTDAYCTFGQIQARRQQWDEAAEFVQLSIRMATNNQDTYYIGYGWRVLGQIYQDAQRPAAAQEALTTALSHFTELDLPHEIAKIHQLLAATVVDGV